MIPLKLEITNFLSYRETAVLDFNGIQLACIAGANGAGKSTMLDAITWSLFGRSRSRSDDDVVNRLAAIQGESAEVRYTFSLENITYRVQRSKRTQKASSLELQTAAGDGRWKTLSESKIRETQSAIEQLLKMSYDTFTNSSLLLQGQADEFTTRTPNQRKEILANLLGVTEWELYRERAAEARKLEQGKLAILENRLEEIANELQEESNRRLAFEEAQKNRAEIAEKLKLQDQILSQLRQTSAAADQQEALAASLQKGVERIRRSLESSEKNFTRREDEKNTYQAIIAQAQEIESQYADWQNAVKEAQQWQEKANTYNRYLQERQPFDLEVAQTRSRLGQIQSQLEEQEKKAVEAAHRQPESEKFLRVNEARLEEIKQSIIALDSLQEELHETRSKLQQVAGERRLLEQELDQLRSKEKQIRILETNKVEINSNKIKAQEQSIFLENELEKIAVQEKTLINMRADLQSIKMQQPLLRQEMDKLKERIRQLESSDAESECPLCGQPLSESHRQEVIIDLTAEGKERGDLWRSNNARLPEVENEIGSLEQITKSKPQVERDLKVQQQRLAQAEGQITDLNQRLSEWEQSGRARLKEIAGQLEDNGLFLELQQQVKALETEIQPRAALLKEQQGLQAAVATERSQIANLSQLINTWKTEGSKKLLQVQRQLSDQDYAAEAKAAITTIQKKIDQLGYDPAADQSAKERQKALGGAESKFQELKQAQAALKPLEDTLADLKDQIDEQKEALLEQEKQYQAAETQLATLRAGIVNLYQTEDEVQLLREEEVKAARRVGHAEQSLKVLDDLRSLQKQINADKITQSKRIQQLQLLEKSCGRSGVQALLIEYALPEIEERANELLDRLTGGSMSILFETQRQLKTRDALSETLDIRITDKDGERPYENYSGGEQFRVNFAIRLALSQLLAKRAGARLQTLIIDEGFGSQDPQGRQRLVEAINIVRDEFACILVITHIDELRDAFPSRIEVTKELQGSTIKVI